MNPKYDALLEQTIDRELKGLRPMKAPEGLHSAVMAAIVSRQTLPGKSPQPWPLWARSFLFALLAAGFLGACYVYGNMPLPGVLNELRESLSSSLSWISLVFGTLQTLGSALCMAITRLGTPVMLGIASAALLAYLISVALGTLWYRFAFDETTRDNNL